MMKYYAIALFLLFAYAGTHVLLCQTEEIGIGNVIGCYLPSMILLFALMFGSHKIKEFKFNKETEESQEEIL